MTKAAHSLFLAIFLAAAPATYAADESPLPQIGAPLEKYPVVRAEFIQTKQMTALKRPLVTSGHLVFSRSQGVLWQIEQPYQAAYILGEDSIVEIAADASRRVRTLREVPGLAQVGRVFRSMLGANTAALRNYFEAVTKGDAARWEMRLTPKQPQLAQFLKGLQLQGGLFVESIQIEENGGDLTRIQFKHSQGSAALTPAEQKIFSGE